MTPAQIEVDAVIISATVMAILGVAVWIVVLVAVVALPITAFCIGFIQGLRG